MIGASLDGLDNSYRPLGVFRRLTVLFVLPIWLRGRPVTQIGPFFRLLDG